MNGVLLDTNLFLLLAVGSADKNLIRDFRRTNSYTPEDFDILSSFLGRFGCVVITPQVLAELTNLLPLGSNDRQIPPVLTAMIRALTKASEEHVPKDVLLKREAILRKVGFTDLSLAEAAKRKGYTVVTDNFRCAGELRAAGCTVANLNQLRTMKWGSS